MRARDFLWRCRVGLHLESGTGNERLTFELQSYLARAMGYKDRMHRPAVEWFMRRYFSHARHVADLADMFIMHFKEQLKPRRFVRRRDLGDGFYLEGKWVGVKDDSVFAEEPLRLLKIFHVAQHEHRRLESDALRTIRANTHYITSAFNKLPEANQLFLSILREKRNIAWALKEMNNTGVLGRFIPDFGRIVAQGQFDRYHAYTVDEHSIRAVAESRNFHLGRADRERFPLACELMPRIKRPWLLYLALLFHDLAKGRRGDHSVNGEHIVRRFCQRLGLSKDDTGLVAWLVRHHLAMAYTSQRSDLGDQTVIEKFAHLVGDMERLQYLYLLTVADICAVGPHVWNDWKGALLRELYHATEQVLVTGPVSGEDMKTRLKARIESALNAASASERAGLSPVLRSLPARALLHFPPMQLLAVGRLMVSCRENTGVAFYVDRVRGETEVLIIAEDHPGLFANLTSP
jgi:[protein-PII] uridylyltransferase